jgi:hypothetical protein
MDPRILTAAAQLATLEDDRVVSGLVLPYGPVGYTSVGPVRVPDRNRVRIPTDLSRVKLMDYHQSPPVAVGVCTAVRHTREGLRASFRVARTPAADAALLEVTEGLRDGLSVELGAIDLDGDELLASDLLGVALVPIPAWADSRHDGLAAARQDSTTTTTTTTPTGDTPMTAEQRARLLELLDLNGRSPEEEAEYAELVRLAAAEPTDPAVDATQTPDLAASHLTPAPTGQPATLPTGLATSSTRRPTDRPLADLYAAQARVLSGHSRAELEAALSDITSTANIWTSGSSYDGQLWSGLEYTRRFVPLMTEGPLTSYKGNGWRWVTKPEVADYAGDKAAVPSNEPETEATEWEAARLAGAHDIDRKFFDFGDSEFISAYYDAMRESYAKQSDSKARAFILSVAASLGAAGAGLFRALATTGAAVEDNTGGQQADYFLINSADRLDLIDIGQGDIPAYLEVFGVTPDKIMVAPGVPAGTVVAGAKVATKFRELSGSPIRVEALRIANGGVDGGLFGYYATEEVFAGGVVKATFL